MSKALVGMSGTLYINGEKRNKLHKENYIVKSGQNRGKRIKSYQELAITVTSPEMVAVAAELVASNTHSATGTKAKGGLPNAAAAAKGKAAQASGNAHVLTPEDNAKGGKNSVKWTTLGPGGGTLPMLRVKCDGKEVGVYQTRASNNGVHFNVWRYKICVHNKEQGPAVRILHPNFPHVSGSFLKTVIFDEASSIWSFAHADLNLHLTLDEVLE
jgi:hypothetical protein